MSDPIQMMPSHSQALMPEDYQALLGLMMAGDPRGEQLAATLSPDEQHQFYLFQQQANKGKGEVSRKDASFLGMPPELAATSAARPLLAAGSGIASFVKSLFEKEGGEAGPPNLQRMPPNVDTRHMMSDTMEQVGRGVQNDFRGPVSFQRDAPLSVPGGVKSAKFGEATQGADQLDALLKATGREQPLGAAGRGTYRPFQDSEKAIEDWMNQQTGEGGAREAFNKQFNGQMTASVKKVKRRSPK
jgi:hypothetical protein